MSAGCMTAGWLQFSTNLVFVIRKLGVIVGLCVLLRCAKLIFNPPHQSTTVLKPCCWNLVCLTCISPARRNTKLQYLLSWGICLSVCLSRSSIVSTRLILSSKFFHHLIAATF